MSRHFDVARLTIEDVPLVIVFLDSAAGAGVFEALERAASAAGMEGELVAVWPDDFGRTRFLARPALHAFLRATGYDQLQAQINDSLETA